MANLRSTEDAAPGHLGSYAWSAGNEAIDATSAMSVVAPDLVAMVAGHGDRLEIRVPLACPATEWSVRAYDPADLSKPGREVTAERESGTVVESVTFAAPARDSIIEVFLRFGARGDATYYWRLAVQD